MVGFLDRGGYRITFDPFSKLDESWKDNLAGLVLSVHVSDDETRVLGDFSGYDIKINIDGDYEGPGTLYLVDIYEGPELRKAVGIGIYEENVA